MPIVPHIACHEPEPDTIISRFMDFPKFRDLFANEELYFRRTDLFKEADPEEALAPDDYIRASEHLVKYDPPDQRSALGRNPRYVDEIWQRCRDLFPF